jgi:polyisoprenoid-binding protein YceI
MSSMLVIALPFAGNWKPDTTNAKINFSVKGPFGTVHGDFKGLKATINFNEKDLSSSSVTATIDAKTVSSGISKRNSDLRNEEKWLNTNTHPLISFHSKKIEKTEKGFKATGDLTLKGITKTIEIPFTFTPNESGGLFKGQFAIKRGDYKIGKPGGSVGDLITINLEVPVKK